MTSREVSPGDAELIAAFLDKKLSDDERRAFLNRLDKEEALYEVFVETVRYRDEATAEGGKVLQSSAWGRKWTQLSAVAALLAVAVATPVLLRNFSEESYAEALVADGRLEPYLTEGWYEQPWGVSRGIRPGTVGADTAFRLGVRALDLEIALRSGAVEDAVAVTYRIEALLEELEASEPLRVSYTVIRRDLERRTAPELLVEQAATQARLLRNEPALSAPFDLGGWAEAGRLAARSGNLDLLRSRVFIRRSDQLRSEGWSEAVSQHLTGISSLLDPMSGELDFERLEREFDSLIERS